MASMCVRSHSEGHAEDLLLACGLRSEALKMNFPMIEFQFHYDWYVLAAFL